MSAKEFDGREPLLVTEVEAARMLGVCSRTIFGLAKRGELSFKKVGSRKLYSVEGLRRFAEGERKSA